jgi:energy-coupling factor transporter ATP-binding protein EcfA2
LRRGRTTILIAHQLTSVLDADQVAVVEAGRLVPFGAQVRRRGGTVTSVDPIYDQPPRVVAAHIRRDLDRTAAWVAAHPTNFDGSYLGSPQAVQRAFEVSVELFATDYAPDEARGALAERAVRSEVRAARCAWQPGGDQLLACWRRPPQPHARPAVACSG